MSSRREAPNLGDTSHCANCGKAFHWFKRRRRVCLRDDCYDNPLVVCKSCLMEHHLQHDTLCVARLYTPKERLRGSPDKRHPNSGGDTTRSRRSSIDSSPAIRQVARDLVQRATTLSTGGSGRHQTRSVRDVAAQYRRVSSFKREAQTHDSGSGGGSSGSGGAHGGTNGRTRQGGSPSASSSPPAATAPAPAKAVSFSDRTRGRDAPSRSKQTDALPPALRPSASRGSLKPSRGKPRDGRRRRGSAGSRSRLSSAQAAGELVLSSPLMLAVAVAFFAVCVYLDPPDVVASVGASVSSSMGWALAMGHTPPQAAAPNQPPAEPPVPPSLLEPVAVFKGGSGGGTGSSGQGGGAGSHAAGGHRTMTPLEKRRASLQGGASSRGAYDTQTLHSDGGRGGSAGSAPRVFGPHTHRRNLNSQKKLTPLQRARAARAAGIHIVASGAGSGSGTGLTNDQPGSGSPASPGSEPSAPGASPEATFDGGIALCADEDTLCDWQVDALLSESGGGTDVALMVTKRDVALLVRAGVLTGDAATKMWDALLLRHQLHGAPECDASGAPHNGSGSQGGDAAAVASSTMLTATNLAYAVASVCLLPLAAVLLAWYADSGVVLAASTAMVAAFYFASGIALLRSSTSRLLGGCLICIPAAVAPATALGLCMTAGVTSFTPQEILAAVRASVAELDVPDTRELLRDAVAATDDIVAGGAGAMAAAGLAARRVLRTVGTAAATTISCVVGGIETRLHYVVVAMAASMLVASVFVGTLTDFPFVHVPVFFAIAAMLLSVAEIALRRQAGPKWMRPAWVYVQFAFSGMLLIVAVLLPSPTYQLSQLVAFSTLWLATFPLVLADWATHGALASILGAEGDSQPSLPPPREVPVPRGGVVNGIAHSAAGGVAVANVGGVGAGAAQNKPTRPSPAKKEGVATGASPFVRGTGQHPVAHHHTQQPRGIAGDVVDNHGHAAFAGQRRHQPPAPQSPGGGGFSPTREWTAARPPVHTPANGVPASGHVAASPGAPFTPRPRVRVSPRAFASPAPSPAVSVATHASTSSLADATMEWREWLAARLHLLYYLCALGVASMYGLWELLPATLAGLVGSLAYLGTEAPVLQLFSGLYAVSVSQELAASSPAGPWLHLLTWVPDGDRHWVGACASVLVRLPLTVAGLASVIVVAVHTLHSAGAGPRAYVARAWVYMAGVYVDVLQRSEPSALISLVMALFSCLCIVVTVVPQDVAGDGGPGADDVATRAVVRTGGVVRVPSARRVAAPGIVASPSSNSGDWWQGDMGGLRSVLEGLPSLTRGRTFNQGALRVAWCASMGFRVAVASSSTGLEWLIGLWLLLWALLEAAALSAPFGLMSSVFAVVAAVAADSDSVVLWAVFCTCARVLGWWLVSCHWLTRSLCGCGYGRSAVCDVYSCRRAHIPCQSIRRRDVVPCVLHPYVLAVWLGAGPLLLTPAHNVHACDTQ